MLAHVYMLAALVNKLTAVAETEKVLVFTHYHAQFVGLRLLQLLDPAPSFHDASGRNVRLKSSQLYRITRAQAYQVDNVSRFCASEPKIS